MEHDRSTSTHTTSNVVDLASFHAAGTSVSTAAHDPQAELLARYLRGEERIMKPATSQLLVEFATCGMDNISNTATREEYVRFAGHFAVFLQFFDRDLITAEKKHVTQFKAHLLHEDGPAKRLAQTCEHCQSSLRGDRVYSGSYVKRHLAAIKALYAYLIDANLVAADPSATVKRPSVVPTRKFIPSEQDMADLFAYPGTPRSHLLVRLGYYAPARRDELASMRFMDIDENGVWRFVEKFGKQHAMQLHPEVLRALRLQRAAQQREALRHPAMAAAMNDPERAYVFLTKTGKPVTPGQLTRVLKRHAVRAGVGVIPATAPAADPKTGKAWDCIDGMTSKLSPHALRRAWATHALNDREDPVPIDVVASVLNHAQIETTRRHYAFTDDERASDALVRRRLG